MCIVTPAQSRFVSTSAQQAECSEPIDFPMLDAASGTVYQGSFESCSGDIEDQTTGANALLPGQHLFFVPGRTLSGDWKVGALVRAYPNRAYSLHPADPRVLDGGMLWWAGAPQTSWQDVPVLLPFVPTAVAVVGQYDPGEEIYGYSNLVALPGYQAAMAPLNSKSVIVGVAGLSFAKANGLQALLSGFESSTSWVEVLYAQQDEPQVQIRRAFIKLIPRVNAAVSWQTLVSQHPLSSPTDNNTLANFAWVGLALLAIGAGQAMSHEEKRNCRWVFLTSGDGTTRSVEKCD
jgi:hypothetical protein